MLGFELDAIQPHTRGERYLMQAITTAGGKKMILLGRRKTDGMRVVIKTTSDPHGMRELEHERECRRVLEEINFCLSGISFPPQRYSSPGVMDTLSPSKPLLSKKAPSSRDRSKNNSRLALKAFKAQESAHATTYGHEQLVTKTFGTMDAATYSAAFNGFKEIYRTNSRAAYSQTVSLMKHRNDWRKGRKLSSSMVDSLPTQISSHIIHAYGMVRYIYLIIHRFGSATNMRVGALHKFHDTVQSLACRSTHRVCAFEPEHQKNRSRSPLCASIVLRRDHLVLHRYAQEEFR